MTSRRQPLANVPNAVNSPFRNVVAGTGKRTRAQAGEAVYGQPPAKKQVIEIKSEDEENVDPKRRAGVTVSAQYKLEEPFSKRANNAQPTAFERKLAAAREKHPSVPAPIHTGSKPAAINDIQVKNGDSLETIRQWQRHYKRQFPHFVFYFDSLADEVRSKAAQQVRSLGAREEKFFSKAVTHVITTRPVPAEQSSNSPEDDHPSTKRSDQHVRPGNAASMLDANLQRRNQSQNAQSSNVVNSRRPQAHAADVLTKARELGIKIWALEKLQRVLKTMLDTATGEEGPTQEPRTKSTVSRAAPKPAKDADLEQLLRQEKVNGPADRDMTVAAQDMCTFKGCYIYIHDMDEKTKPVMVRDYQKPASKEQGKWPQFRLTPAGRCPFVEDPSHTKKLQEQERQAGIEAKAQQDVHVTRAAASQPAPRALADRDANLRRSPRKLAPNQKQDLAKPLDPPKQLPTKRQSSAEGMPLFGSAQVHQRGLPRMVGGEPMASGMQQSNITSAIRSQVVSSAAISSTAPGLNRRVGDSKEVSQLKRKMLDRGPSHLSQQSVPSSYLNDMRAAINDNPDPPPRAAKRKAQETLCTVNEDEEASTSRSRTQARKAVPRKRKAVEKEPKPGYCENCRDKFDDWDEVCRSNCDLRSDHLANANAAHRFTQAPQIRTHARQLERARFATGPAQAS